MKKILYAIFFITLHTTAANYNGEVKSFKQPDGTSVDLKLFGSEYYMRAEGLEGYTLIRDPESKWICYAKLSADGNSLESTGEIYHGVLNNSATLRSDLAIQKHLQINPDARRRKIEETQLQLDGVSHQQERLRNNINGNTAFGTPIYHPAGNIVGLCIVIDFSDQPASVPISEFTAFCNDLNYTNYGNNGSIRSFYQDVSGGLLDYQNVVFGYYRAPQTFAFYDSQPMGTGARSILGQALNWIASTGFDFSTLSLNPDNTIMAINMMYTGDPPTWGQGMWFHKGNYTNFNWNGIRSNVYNTSPASAPLSIATVVHENGHMVCKWPDTYKYDQSEDGIGAFDMMCATGSPNNPVPPNPLFRSNAGWGEVIDVSSYHGMNYDTANSMIAYRYNNPADTNEFFLFEHRQKTDRSTFIPDEGLTIWHLNRNGDNQTTDQEVYLEHANNNISDDFSACYINPYTTEFSVNTTPSSDWYDGSPSGLMIWGIDSPSTDILPYHIGLDSAVSHLELAYASTSNDGNGNGYPEAGETTDLNVDITNTGQISSSGCTLTCMATGPNAGYVTINSAGVNIGPVGLALPVSGAINIAIDPATPIGTVIDFQFLITDGVDSASATGSVLIGRQVSMNNATATLCSAIFFDQGIFNNYNNNSNFTKTIRPSTPGNSISADFIAFDLESEPACANDYLKIYDGPNNASPLIGTFCGTMSPGHLQSTDSSGALTFEFHSNAAVTASGWQANISCVPFTGIEEAAKNALMIYPNPTGGLIHLKGVAKNIYVEDAMGRIVMRQKNSDSMDQSVDLRGLSAGVYMICFESGSGPGYRKIIKSSDGF